jgi:hypothetical protein
MIGSYMAPLGRTGIAAVPAEPPFGEVAVVTV